VVSAAAPIASGGPWNTPGLDFFDGMGQANVDDVRLYFSDPDAARANNGQDRDEVLTTTLDQQTEMLKSLLSETDAAVLTGGFAEWLLRQEQTGLAPGDEGWWDHQVAQFSPWGFDLDAVAVRVKVWHGRHDRFVSFRHGAWLADHIPSAEAVISDADGHLTLVLDRIGDVHDWLADHS
jgi:pimeloyl-ACP methyl ester carboxylesterase